MYKDQMEKWETIMRFILGFIMALILALIASYILVPSYKIMVGEGSAETWNYHYAGTYFHSDGSLTYIDGIAVSTYAIINKEDYSSLKVVIKKETNKDSRLVLTSLSFLGRGLEVLNNE